MKEESQALQKWYDDWETCLNAISNPRQFMQRCPDSGSPAERLELLLKLRNRLGLDDTSMTYELTSAQKFAARHVGQSSKDALVDLLESTIASIDQDIATCLDSGVQSTELIRTADFGKLGESEGLFIFNTSTMGTPQSMYLIAASLHVLPSDHWLHSALPTEDFYKLLTGNRSVILGPVRGSIVGVPSARRFYVAKESLYRWTPLIRNRQKQLEFEAEEQAKREREQERKDFLKSEVGQHLLKERATQRLRERGQIPASVLAEIER